jgi:DNA polymerase (family 10)
MHPQNSAIKNALTQIADLLELQHADPLRVRAYRRASSVVAGLPLSVHAMRRGANDLRDVRELPEGLVPTIRELADTGDCAMLQRLRAEIPRGLGARREIAHLGPKRVRALHEELGIASVDDLHAAAAAGRLQALPGFGPRLEHQILKATSERLSRARRLPVDVMGADAARLGAWLAQLPDVQRVEVAGELRRGVDSLADLDLVAESASERDVVSAFAAHPDVTQVPFAGLRRIGVVMHDSLQVHLQVAAPGRFGACWLARTGSPAHLRHLAREAARLRMTLDETGLARGTTSVAAAREEDIYAALGLAWIPPELREDHGEIEAAAAGTLPRLVERADVRGDLRVGTRDGGRERELLPIVTAARARGLAYVAIADHVRRLDGARESDLSRLARQMDDIDRLNERLGPFVVLKGAHVDILDDGRLNVPDDVLARLDLVVGSVDDLLDMTRRRQTDRLMRAMDNRFFSILASPTGRLVEERRPYQVDLPRLLRHARERGCFIEANGAPARLDLDGAGCALARAAGVLVAIDSAASSPANLDDLRHGVTQARRGGLQAGDVLNTRAVEDVRALLARTMRR